MKYHLWYIVLLVFAASANAQPYYFRHYQVEKGLSNNTVFCSTQDKNGFMWFGTKDGLNRFDGYHFKRYNINNEGYSMTPDIISCLVVDKQNTLWIGCQKGLYFFDRQKEALVPFIDSLAWIRAMHIDNAGQLWFISARMLCRYNFATKTLTKFPEARYFAATSLCSAANGDMWISTVDGFLQRYDSEKNSFTAFNLFSHSPPSISTWIQKIYPAGNNAIYVGTSSQGLKKIDIGSSSYKDILTLNPDKTTIYIRDIEQYGDNEYWFATESGIFIHNTITNQFTNLKKKFLDPYSLSDNAVYSLCKDREGGMWAGTYFGGVNYYSQEYAVFQKYFPDNSASSISGSAVREICEDRTGNIWIATEDAGLNKLDPATGAITQFKPSGESSSIAYSNIHGLLITGNDLWIGTFDHGLDVMDIKTGKVKTHYESGPGKYKMKSNFILTLLQTQSGEIYTGTGSSLYKFDPKIKGFNIVSEVEPNIFVAALLEDHDKNIWVGTHGNGIFFFNPVTGKKGHFENQPGNQNSLTNNIINAIFEDSKQNLWISTEGGGLVKLSKDRKTFTTFTTKNGLPSNFIFKVLEDDKQNLWVTTSRGLVNFNPQTSGITVYTKDNGLLNDQFNYNSGYRDAKGKMYFGSVKGMITFMPDDFLKPNNTPPVYITGFQVKNKELEINEDSSFLKKSIIYTDEITLPYDHSSISIDFAALSYVSPEMTEYSYIMKGLDKDWTHLTSNRKVYFTSLKPGTYTFKVKATSNGFSGKHEKALTIKILPPFWATTWAYLVYVVAGASLLYYLVRTYHNRQENKKEKEIYEAKIEFFTNIAHEIKTPLTLIKGPVDNLSEMVNETPGIKEDVMTMERNTKRLVNLINQILDFRQTETKGFSLDFINVNMKEILSEAYLTFEPVAKKKKLDYSMELPPTSIHTMADAEALNKIFSNLFSNAVKYADTKVSIKLAISSNEKSVIVKISNDGNIIPAEMKEKIFEPFFRLKESIKQKGTGIGLALARSLAELHKGDLYLQEPEEEMNVFILRIPYLADTDKRKNTKGITTHKVNI